MTAAEAADQLKELAHTINAAVRDWLLRKITELAPTTPDEDRLATQLNNAVGAALVVVLEGFVDNLHVTKQAHVRSALRTLRAEIMHLIADEIASEKVRGQ